MFKSDFIVSGAEVNLSSDTSPQTLVSSWWIAVLVPILLPPPSSSLTLTLLSTCSARHHTLHRRFLIPSDGLCIATLISLSYPPSFSLSLHRLPSIEISKNRSDFSSIFHNPPFHLIFDHNIHSYSINYIYSFLFFFPLPQYFHSLDRWRAIVILFPSPHSLTSPTPLPSPSSIRTTQSSASIDLLRERSRKSRFRERETSEVEMRSEKEQLGDKLEKGWGGDMLTFSLAQVRSCAISPRGGRVPRSRASRLFLLWNSVDTSRLWNSPRSAPATSTLRLATAGQPFLRLLSPFSLLLPRFLLLLLLLLLLCVIQPIFAHRWFSSPPLPAWLKLIFDRVNVSMAGELGGFSNIDWLIKQNLIICWINIVDIFFLLLGEFIKWFMIKKNFFEFR